MWDFPHLFIIKLYSYGYCSMKQCQEIKKMSIKNHKKNMFYNPVKSKKSIRLVQKAKTNSMESIDIDTPEKYTPEQRAQGIRVLTELGCPVFKNFMGGIKKC